MMEYVIPLLIWTVTYSFIYMVDVYISPIHPAVALSVGFLTGVVAGAIAK